MFHLSRRTKLLLCAFPAVVPLLTAGGCQGTTLTVTTTVDELNNDGDCSLREAARASNLDAPVDACPAGNGADTIALGVGTYRLTVVGQREQEGLAGDLDFLDSVTINGAGSGATIIDGNGTERIIDVFAPASVTINDLTIRNGLPAPGRRGGAIVVLDGSSLALNRTTVEGNATADGPDRIPDGGGIYNDGTMVIVDSTIRDNTAGGNEGSGGGIWNSGNLTLTRSTVSGNHANGSDSVTFAIDGGGGIYNAGTLNLTTSTISANTANYRAGGVGNTGTATVSRSTFDGNVGLSGGAIHATSTLTVTNSTLSGNSARSSGGGVWSSTTQATLASLTVAGNVADSDQNGSGDGGGLAVGTGGTVFARNTLLAGNADRGGEAPDCRTSGALQSQGYNRFGSLVGCVVSGDTTGNQVGAASLLGPLAANGGPNRTRALLEGSPAIDAANPGAPGGGGSTCPTTDQRAVARPQDGNNDSVARCDIGAYERVPD
ncbi:MAG: choice-of-anchor Q domain-containing protein [Acidimicrobiales bacterium]